MTAAAKLFLAKKPAVRKKIFKGYCCYSGGSSVFKFTIVNMSPYLLYVVSYSCILKIKIKKNGVQRVFMLLFF